MSTILEVAIGLVFVFLLFSLLASAINEAIFGHLTHLRSRVLEDSLHAILSGKSKGFSAFAWVRNGIQSLCSPKNKSGGTVVPSFSDSLLKHPLVEGLAVSGRGCPSYLPAETFVDAALGTILKQAAEKSKSSAVLELDKITATELGNALKSLEDPHAQEIFSSVLVGATSLKEARSRLETWFNSSMERVSGAYRRYSQFWLYVWAALIVVWLNVDTIEIARRLLSDAQFRGAVAASATDYLAQAHGTNLVSAAGDTNSTLGNLSPAELLREINQLNLPIGWGACTRSATTNSAIGWVLSRLPRFEQSGAMTNSAIPGLVNGVLTAGATCPATPEGWRLKLLGLIITIAAISQGAPFWFDLLNRVTNIRASGRPPTRKNGSG